MYEHISIGDFSINKGTIVGTSWDCNPIDGRVLTGDIDRGHWQGRVLEMNTQYLWATSWWLGFVSDPTLRPWWPSCLIKVCNHETHENRYVWHSLYKRQSWSPGGIANNNGRHAGMDRNWATCSSDITPWTKGMHWGYDAETAVSGIMDYSLKPRIAWDVFGTWTSNHPMSSKCSPGFTNIKQISVNMIP